MDYTQRDAAGVYECFVEEASGTYPLVTAELIVVGEFKWNGVSSNFSRSILNQGILHKFSN